MEATIRACYGKEISLVFTVIMVAAMIFFRAIAFILGVYAFAGKIGKKGNNVGVIVVMICVDIETYYRAQIAKAQNNAENNPYAFYVSHYGTKIRKIMTTFAMHNIIIRK